MLKFTPRRFFAIIAFAYMVLFSIVAQPAPAESYDFLDHPSALVSDYTASNQHNLNSLFFGQTSSQKQWDWDQFRKQSMLNLGWLIGGLIVLILFAPFLFLGGIVVLVIGLFNADMTLVGMGILYIVAGLVGTALRGGS